MHKILILNFAIIFLLITTAMEGGNMATGQVLGGTVSGVTNMVNNTVSTVTNTVTVTTSGVTNQTISPVINSTITNVANTSGSTSTGNILGIPLPNVTLPVSASTDVAGVQVFGNGTFITSINGVSMSFLFDPQGPRGMHNSSSNDPPVAVISDDLSGNEIAGIYVELQNSRGSDISAAYTPATFATTSGTNYIIYANNYQNFVFDHWDDGSTDPARPITPTQSMSLVAYYSTGSTSTAPMPPTDLAVKTTSSSEIDLSWNAPASNGGSPITGYKVERSVDGGVNWSTIAQNTGDTSTTYSDKGLQAGNTYTYRVSAINSIGTSKPSNISTGSTFQNLAGTINKVRTGFVASDMLTNETKTQQQLLTNKGYWNYDGDAPIENAPFNFSRDSSGLHIGVRAPSDGTWAGFFAESPNHSAKLWSAIVSNPVRSTQKDFYENGLYVQTANGSINYVTCSTFTGPQGTVWGVINATGNTDQVTSFDILWLDKSPNQPLTRDCSMVTDGNHLLKVYLDGSKVYEEDNGNLQMPSPFNAYLEPESSDGEEFLVGSYSNYYVNDDEKIQINQLPQNAARVDLVGGSNVLESSSASGGLATMDVGQFTLPLSAALQVYDSNNNLIASGSENIFGGDVYSFAPTVNSAPVAPANLQAEGGNNMISLSWLAPTNNGGSPVTNYKVYRSSSQDAESFLVQTGNVTAYDDTSVVPGQPYFYKVTAINSVGESSPSNEATASSAISATPPSAPNGLQAQPGSGKVSLSWQSPSSNGGAQITEYRIYRGTVSNGEATGPIGTTAGSVLTFNDNSVTNGQEYFYKVTATNSAGESNMSNEASATPVSSVVAPSAPSGLVASAVSSSGINLTWTAPSSDGGTPITGYKIERSSDGGATWSTIVSNTTSTATAYSDSGLVPSTTYFYRISAINAAGTSPPSNVSSTTTGGSTTGVPLTPSALSGTPVSYSQINLTWTAPSSDGGTPITGYKIERSANGGTTWSPIAPDTGVANTSYSDTGLAAGMKYEYRVSAINAVGSSSPSNTATVITLATVPSSPTGLSATEISSSEIDLSWNAPGWDGGATVTGYMIQRSTDGGTTWSTIVDNTTSTNTSFQDKGLQAGMTFTYQVLAINSAGKSTHSNTASTST